VVRGTYVCVLTATLLRGHGGFYLELAGLQKHLTKGRLGVVPPGLNKSMLLSEEVCRNLSDMTVCLLGKFKGKTGTNHHLIAIANNIILGLQL
jgi:hypothetical protein